uniref:NME/NM23 family member 5 n=1 Tax=Equus caballus TaxID=9796 RepID=A0A9L0T4U0_HORSE
MEISMPPPQIYVEKTLAIIKPDIVDKEEEIQDIILRSGFTIVQCIEMQLGASLVVKWLSLHTLLWQLRFSDLDPGHRPTHCSSSYAVVASHIEELE